MNEERDEAIREYLNSQSLLGQGLEPHLQWAAEHYKPKWRVIAEVGRPAVEFRGRFLVQYCLGDYWDIDIVQYWAEDGWTNQEGEALGLETKVIAWMPLPEPYQPEGTPQTDQEVSNGT